MRRAELADKRKPRFPENHAGDLWGNHIEAAQAELAVCKLMGWYWDGSVDTVHRSGVPGRAVEIRWNPSRQAPLKIREDDCDICVVGVTGQSPSYEILGWFWSEDAKRTIWQHSPRSGGPLAFLVPQDELYDISELDDYLREWCGGFRGAS